MHRTIVVLATTFVHKSCCVVCLERQRRALTYHMRHLPLSLICSTASHDMLCGLCAHNDISLYFDSTIGLLLDAYIAVMPCSSETILTLSRYNFSSIRFNQFKQ